MSLTTGLVGYWKFDEANTDGTAMDSVGTNHGTYSAAKPTVSTAVPAALSGKSTHNLVLSGSLTEVTLPAGAFGTWTMTSSYSISVWVSVAILDRGWMGIVANESAANYCGLYVSDTNNFAYQAGNPANEAGFSATTPPTPNVWYHVALVQDGTANSQRMYVNGSLLPASRTAVDCSTTASFHIGSPDGAMGYFAGSVDDLRFYNRALNQNEVTALSAGQVQ